MRLSSTFPFSRYLNRRHVDVLERLSKAVRDERSRCYTKFSLILGAVVTNPSRLNIIKIISDMKITCLRN